MTKKKKNYESEINFLHADWLNNISWYYAKLGRFERASLENVRKQELVQCICFRCWSPASLGSFASTGSGLALELLLSFGFGISSLASWWAINGSQWDSQLKQQTIKFWLKPGAEDSLACGWVSQLFDWAISTPSWAAHTSWKKWYSMGPVEPRLGKTPCIMHMVPLI